MPLYLKFYQSFIFILKSDSNIYRKEPRFIKTFMEEKNKEG